VDATKDMVRLCHAGIFRFLCCSSLVVGTASNDIRIPRNLIALAQATRPEEREFRLRL